METDRYRRIAEIFGGALDRSAADRERYLDEACAGDEELRNEIRILLEESARSSVFVASTLNRGAGARGPAGPRALPERLGGYRILSVLGAGGMGEVYLAEQERPHRRVALKVMRPGIPSDALAARFQHEAELLGRIQHPGIAQVYEAGIVDGPDGPCPFIAMQFVEGSNLGAGRNRSPDGSAETPRTRDEMLATLILVEKVARSLHAAHEAGVVHRDIKPQNILVTPDGSPVVVDFGVARDLFGELQTLTLTGEQPGTPAYMSPEQVDGRRGAVDRRTDVWSLGVVLWELVCGRRPYDRANRAATLYAITHDPLPDPRLENPRISSDLAVVMATALERNLGRRYLNAAVFADDLAHIRRREPIQARPAPPWLKVWRWVERHPAVAGSLAAAILCLAAGLGVTLHQLGIEIGLRMELQEQVDSRLLGEYEAATRSLWPVLPETVPRIDAWLRETGEFEGRFADHEALHAAGLRRTSLDALAAGAGKFRRLREDIAGRRRQAIENGRVSLEGAADRWQSCASSLATDSRFQGLALKPRAGLVPLGRDSRSGLWEFWLVASGGRPGWEGSLDSGMVVIDDTSGIVLVLIPGSVIPLKTRKETYSITLAPFLFGKHELTQEQWLRVMDENPSNLPIGKRLPKNDTPITGRHPVTNVTWNDVLEAAGRLGLELPTMAQWEFAAKAGTTTPWWSGPDAASLSGCENIGDAASEWITKEGHPAEPGMDDGYRFTAPVGMLRPNPFGIHDILGNVMEWCGDRGNGRPRGGDGAQVEDPKNELVLRLIRGGSFFQPAVNASMDMNIQAEGRDTGRQNLGARLSLTLR